MMTPEILEKLPAAERRAYLATLSYEEMLDFALVCVTRFEKQVDAFRESLYENFERRLATDENSRVEADRVLQRLTGS
jgi:DNA-binding transcriptional regulator/RsmH inhibitor MraZ